MSPIAHDFYPWLNQELLEKTLKASENSDSAQVIGYELYDAVGKGQNFTSHLVRVSVTFIDQSGSTPKHKSFIVKTTLAPEINARFEKIALFKKEVTFYRDILPRFDKYLDVIGRSFTFTARCFEVSADPSYFVFEDLNEKEFRNIDRRSGLNFEATSMVLEKVAKYHAMTAMLCCDEPELCEVFKIKVVDPDDSDMIKVFLCSIKDCEELSRNWPGYEHLSPKLEKLSKVFIDKVQTVFELDESEFNVIRHGDLWINNILFKFDDDNNPIDTILVDFQMGYFGSPGIDLTYLLLTSTTNDIQEAEWDRLLGIYHAELIRTLKCLNYPRPMPSLTDIQIQMLKRSLYSITIALLILGPRYMEKTEHADTNLFIFENEKVKKIRQELYDHPEVKERILYLLDYFERKGFLESD